MLICCTGLCAWLALWWTGKASLWPNLAVAGAVGLLLLVNVLYRPSRHRRAVEAGAVAADEPHGRGAGNAAERPSRPNAVRLDYNTLLDEEPAPPALHAVPRAQDGSAEHRGPGHEYGSGRLPPPVPPPLFGRPGSRPIVAGMEHTVGRARAGGAVEDPESPGETGEARSEHEVAAAAAPELTTPVQHVPEPQPVPADSGATAFPSPTPEPAPSPAPASPEAGRFTPVSALPASHAAAEEPSPTAGPQAPQGPTAATLPALTEAERRSLGLEDPPARQAGAAAPAEPAAPAQPTGAAPSRDYVLPPIDLLPLPASERGLSEDEVLERALLLERTLASFGVEAKVVDFSFGPAVTRYELQPAPGVRVNKFTALADDIALALAAVDVRVEAPIPGKSAVGIEVPNKERLAVPLREVLESPEFRQSPSKLTVAFGKDNSGHPVVGDLARMPHLLIAGATGSGKSVCMNTIICSLLFKARPDEVKMLMIDPKMVELSIYDGIPHLIAPVVTDVRKAAGYLKGAVHEMEARYELFAAAGVRNIEQYNRQVAEQAAADPAQAPKPLPYIVIFIDELADLMMVAPADVEDAICRLAQMARACGIHLVIATQSPRVDVITGLIKANIPSRIAFAVSSQVDSRVILDAAGAERLLGRGDMLYHPSGLSKPLRAQGAYISETSVEELVRFVKQQGRPEYTAVEVPVENGNGNRKGNKNGSGDSPAPTAVDEALPEAARIIIEHGQASVSLLQRRLRCNYTKAARIIDELEAMGLVGPHQGSKPREVLATMETWQQLFGSRSGQEAGRSERCGETKNESPEVDAE